eukprot:SAG11_NODE_2321_length_3524_cov_3.939270_3_plen_335_part_00
MRAAVTATRATGQLGTAVAQAGSRVERRFGLFLLFQRVLLPLFPQLQRLAGNFISQLLARLVIEGVVVTSVIAKGYELYRWKYPGVENLFKGRVNVSLNMLRPTLGDDADFDAASLEYNEEVARVDMRTLHECALEEMFSDKHVQRQIEAAAGKTKKQDPFVLVPKAQLVRLSDQMKNRLSMHFATAFVQQDLGCEVTQRKYWFAVTNEPTDGAILAKKFRVLLVREDSLKAMATALRTRLHREAPGRAGAADRQHYCLGEEDQLAAFAPGRFPYENTRLKHLYMLFWKHLHTMTTCSVDTLVPIAGKIDIAMVKPAGATQLENRLSETASWQQ